MRKLLFVAILGTVVASVTMVTPEGTFVKNGACHFKQFLVDGDPIYEDSNVCVIHYPSSEVYWAIIPFVQTIGQYREQKAIAEQRIQEKARDQKCLFVWVPAMKVKPDLIHSDLVTIDCEEPTGGK